MSNKLRIVMAQLNLTVGDFEGNFKKHLAAANKARDELKADVILFSELSLTGYPPEDLINRPAFLDLSEEYLKKLQDEIKGIHCIVGHPQRSSKGLLNSASVLYNGEIIGRCSKRHLPNYGVFDEKRYFIPGEFTCVINIKNIPISLLICEDLWFPGPAQDAALHGAKLILSPNASPFEIDKHEKRYAALRKRTKATGIPIFYNNCVGGQDDLVFDGGSMVVNGKGEICQLASFFQEDLLPVDVDFSNDKVDIARKEFSLPSEEEKVYNALVLGVRDYVKKNNFKGTLLGLSGGVDSALALCIAVEPSQFVIYLT